MVGTLLRVDSCLVSDDQSPEMEPVVEAAPGILYDAEKRLEESIVAFDRHTDGANAILTGWVLIAEWIDADGNPAMSAHAREGMPYWRIDGLLSAAPDQFLYIDDDDY